MNIRGFQIECLLAAIVAQFAATPLVCIGGGAEEPSIPAYHCNEEFVGLDAHDFVCGSRCVQFVLEDAGQHVDLIDLVREMQWPDLEQGVDLEKIAEAPEDRGIHTSAIRLSPHAKLKWPHPAIVHLAREHERWEHFVVCLPTSSRDVDLWCGLQGVQRLSQDQFRAECSGAVLLTAPEQIADPGLAVQRDAAWGYHRPFLAAVFLAICVFALWFVRKVQLG